MKKYKILLYNENNNLIYNEIVQADDEEQALINFIKNIATITSGDTIKINEE